MVAASTPTTNSAMPSEPYSQSYSSRRPGHHIHALQYDQQERRNAKEAGDQAEAAADEAGEQREQQVARRDRQPPVAEPHVRADERAVLFDHARHGGQAHHHGHQQEHNRERVAERLDGVEVGFERAEPAERLPVLHIPAYLRNVGFSSFPWFQRCRYCLCSFNCDCAWSSCCLGLASVRD